MLVMTRKLKNQTVAAFALVLVAVSGVLFHKPILSAFAADNSASAIQPNVSEQSSFKAHGDTIEVNDDTVGPAGITVTKVEVRDVPMTLTLTGKSGLNLETATHIQPQFAGKIVSIAPKLGDFVKGPDEPGGPTVLCVIESNDLAQAKSNWLQAKIQLKIDGDNLARTRELYKANVLSEKIVIDAESAVIKDQASLEAAYQQLLIFGLKQNEIDDIEHQIGKQRMDYLITAPRSGVVAEKDVAGGEIATPGNNLFVIADTKTLWIVGDVYEKDVSRIKLGQPMEAFFTCEPDRPRLCKITWISPVLDPNTHAVHIQGVLDNGDGHILSDMYCTIVVTISEGEASIIVPADAVVREGTDAFVFVLTGRNGSGAQYRLVPVKTDSVDVGFGASQTASAAISSAARSAGSQGGSQEQSPGVLRIVEGLKSGDMIITSGALGLYNDMKQQANAQ
jgi:membrane fusion protein, heavy metal efflux system